MREVDPGVLLLLPLLVVVVVVVALNDVGEKGTETGFFKELLLIKLPEADDDGTAIELLWKDNDLGLFN